MQNKNVKLIVILGIAAVVVAAVIIALVFMSRGTIKVAVNIPADTIKIIKGENDVKAVATGLKETEQSSLSSGNYTIEVIAAGYLKEKKEVKLGWMSTVSESFVLQPDTGSVISELTLAENALLGNWNGEFGGAPMTLVLDDLKPGTVSGYDNTGGKKRKVNGTYRYENEKYYLTLNEPGDKKDEGQFVMIVDKSAEKADGNWESFDKKMKYAVGFEKEKGQTIVNKSAVSSTNEEAVNVQKQQRLLKILNATYGSSWKNHNVTSLLNRKINNDNIWVEVSNATFGDPDPGKPKTLTVSYEYRGRVYNKILHEKMIFRVP